MEHPAVRPAGGPPGIPWAFRRSRVADGRARAPAASRVQLRPRRSPQPQRPRAAGGASRGRRARSGGARGVRGSRAVRVAAAAVSPADHAACRHQGARDSRSDRGAAHHRGGLAAIVGDGATGDRKAGRGARTAEARRRRACAAEAERRRGHRRLQVCRLRGSLPGVRGGDSRAASELRPLFRGRLRRPRSRVRARRVPRAAEGEGREGARPRSQPGDGRGVPCERAGCGGG